MEIKIPKEIRDYQESIFFGLFARQFIFSVLAIGVAVGVYFLLREPLGFETVSWVCILCAAPFAAMGFFRYNGLSFEQFVLVWIRAEFLMPKHLPFKAENLYEIALNQYPRKENNSHDENNPTRQVRQPVESQNPKVFATIHPDRPYLAGRDFSTGHEV